MFQISSLSFFIKNEDTIQIVEPYVRKAAHFSEYAFGGLLFVLLFYTYKWTDRKIIIVSVLLGVWYAGMDELHQLMIAQRHASIFDIYIDSLGFSTGVLSMLLLIKVVEIIVNKKKKNKKV